MGGRGPGVVDTDRQRRGAFASLIGKIQYDVEVLDGVAFAYTELDATGRRALTRAVVHDSPDPALTLGAFLTLETDSSLITELGRLIRLHNQREPAATLESQGSQGEACLIRPVLGRASEVLTIAWNDNEVHRIDLESRIDLNPTDTIPVDVALETVTPLLWSYLRGGGVLPKGADRFAAFF